MERTHVDMQLIYGTSALYNPTPKIDKPILTFPGQTLSDQGVLQMNDEILSKHLLLLGSSGCGKTATICHAVHQLRQRMNKNDVAIVFDTKGEYYDLFCRQTDIVIGNDSKFHQISAIPNLFREAMADGIDDLKIDINIREIATALFYDRGSASQPFFANAARDIFRAIMLHFIRSAKRDPAIWGNRLNHKDLLAALNSYSVTDYRRIFQYYPDMRNMISYIGDGTSNQALGVLAELKSMISDYFVGIFAEHKPERGVCMRSTVRQRGGKVIFLEYDLAIGETLTPIYRLLVDQALKEALSRNNNQTDKSEGRVYLVADEFKLLPKLQHIDDALNFGRGLGVRVIAGIQSLDQLYEVYGERKATVLASGFGSLFAYHTNDDSSRCYISGRLGKNMSYYSYHNRFLNQDDKDKRQGYTIENWDQMELEVGQAVIALCDRPPFIYHFCDYD